MKKLDIHRELWHKVLFEQKCECIDEFGSSEDEKRKFGFYFKLSKVYTLSGVVYRFEVPNYTYHDKNLTKGMWEMLKYIHDDGMRYYRLKEELTRKGIMKTL